MTQRQQVREAIRQVVQDANDNGSTSETWGQFKDAIATQILNLPGVVILDPNQEIPPVVNEIALMETAGTPYSWYIDGQRNLVKAGWRKCLKE